MVLLCLASSVLPPTIGIVLRTTLHKWMGQAINDTHGTIRKWDSNLRYCSLDPVFLRWLRSMRWWWQHSHRFRLPFAPNRGGVRVRFLWGEARSDTNHQPPLPLQSSLLSKEVVMSTIELLLILTIVIESFVKQQAEDHGRGRGGRRTTTEKRRRTDDVR